ncbi:MAG: bifunctional (p)ppGpp synthetase/guanosine-3',5'-bis(diphosphate) 3'-pyrophosphohydrolase [Myxococcales bacterium]|jgi:GTP pyrophosphokinase|nr:bifunctional (p)ppGpp synthetase/guanosine-3',5'-bis(diphosphate) 3'-pyrophosphohydrolase [Myxococcales bacterium]
MLRLNDILDRVQSYHPDADLDAIKKAYVFSAKVHQGQVRKSGEPYLIHPLEVAGILARLKLDEASIITGLLHDTIEDTLTTMEDITELFGAEVAQLVDGVTKLSQLSANASQEEKQAENFRKMIVAMARDIRVILVKLADRSHNMRTLEHMLPEKQKRIAQETLDIYAPLANRLGIGWIKQELEDLSFKYLKPAEFQDLHERMERKKKASEKYIEDVQDILRAKLAENNLSVLQVQGRFKNLYSIDKKMKKGGLTFDQVHDLIAFRLIMPSMPACYAALGLVHTLWKPIPGRFKDYIAIPKPNLYQSLHTTVIGPFGDHLEVQIRTEEMHRIAEEGIAAHWAYKEGKAKSAGDDATRFGWLRQLMDWVRDLKDPKEFLDAFKGDLFADEVFVFTPSHDVKTLPLGATPVDFAYSIHSDIGDRCVGAKVDGKIVPLRYQLKNGDTVEVLTNPNSHPSKDWLNFVKSSRALARIRGYIKEQQRGQSLELGKGLTERELKRFNLTLNKLIKSGEFKKTAEALGFRTEEALLVAVGYGKVLPTQILAKHVSPEKLADKEAVGVPRGPELVPEESTLTRIINKVTNRDTKSGVRINGIDDALVIFGRCCGPVPGDPIIGFITRGRGITVHTASCDKVLATDPNRRIEVTWDVKPDFTRPVTLRIMTTDRAGMIADISTAFSKKGVSIIQANCRVTTDDRAVNTFEVKISNLKQLEELRSVIERISGVIEVMRS